MVSSSHPPIGRAHRLTNHQVREPAEEHLRRQIAPMLMAEWTPGCDGLGRHCLDRCWDILATTLALNHDALGGFRSGEHEDQYRRRKGESNPQGCQTGGKRETLLIYVIRSCWDKWTMKQIKPSPNTVPGPSQMLRQLHKTIQRQSPGPRHPSTRDREPARQRKLDPLGPCRAGQVRDGMVDERRQSTFQRS